MSYNDEYLEHKFISSNNGYINMTIRYFSLSSWIVQKKLWIFTKTEIEQSRKKNKLRIKMFIKHPVSGKWGMTAKYGFWKNVFHLKPK